jgi:hypothetical protein
MASNWNRLETKVILAKLALHVYQETEDALYLRIEKTNAADS